MELPPAQLFNNPRGQAINRLIHLGDAPPPVTNAPANDPDRFIRRAVPKANKDDTSYPHWKKSFEDLANDGPGFEVLLHDVDSWLTTVQSHSSPSSQKKRDAMEFKWSKFVTTIEPGINEDRLWHSDVILRYSDKFLYVLNHLAQGTKGRKNIKATTLEEFMMLFTWCIARNSRDPDTLLTNGTFLLSKKRVINTSNLDRHQDKKIYFGRSEIKLMIETGLNNSARSGRIAAMRSFCILLTCFYTSIRPGSMGWSFAQYRDQGKYPKLEDIEVFRVGPMTFKVLLKIKNFKGHNTTVDAQMLEYWLNPVQRWENVTFDVAFWFVLYLMVRDAFDGISTTDDLRNYTNYTLPIKEEKKQEPLFLACTSRGRDFEEPPQPMSSHAASAACSNLSREAGMVKSSLYSIRRETANRYEVLIGKARAALVMGHTDTGSLKHYSHNTGNIDLVGITLDELPGSHKINNIHAHAMNKDATPAVLALVNLTDNEKASTNPELSLEEKLELQMADPIMTELAIAECEAWDAWLACYSPRSDGAKFGRTLAVVKRFLEAVGVELLVSQDAADAAFANVKKAVNDAVTHRRLVLRRGQAALDAKEDERRAAALQGSMQDLKEAADQLAKPSHFLTAAATPISTLLPTLLPPSPSISSSIPSSEDPLIQQLAAEMQIEEEEVEEALQEKEKEIDCEIQGFFRSAIKLITIEEMTGHADHSTEEMAQLVDENEVPTSIADLEAPPPPDVEFTAADIRSSFMEVVLQPIFLQRALEAMSKDNGGKWQCPYCRRLYGHDPKAQELDHKLKSNLERHISRKHTAWMDLVVKMITSDKDVFKCPTEGCTFTAKKVARVRSHCLEDCAESDTYNALADAHNEKQMETPKPKGGSRISSTQLVKQVEQRRYRYTGALKKIRSSFDELEYEERRMELQADVNDLVNQGGGSFSTDKAMQVLEPELDKLFHDLADVSDGSEFSDD